MHCGAGRNLREASAPGYLETPNGRVALISVNCDFDSSAMAGEQTARVPGRPGINGLRIEKRVELPSEEFAYLKELAKETNINAEKEIVRKEGYFAELAEGEGEFGELKFFLDKESRCVMQINEKDMQRVELAICEARKQADYVMISIHTHQICGDTKEIVPEFLQDFAHRCIDLGAHAILGHGPHLLRPIEVYKNCPIFYSLGDFVLQLYDIEVAPADFYSKHGMPTDATVYELLKKRSKNFTVGLMEDKRMSRSVIPFWETDGTKLTSLKLMPIEMVMKGDKSVTGLPRRSANPEIAEYLADMCKPYGTKVVMTEDGLLECKWN